MERRFGFISSDEHVVEHPRVWTQRVSKSWGERVPHLVEQADGSQRWLVDGRPVALDGVAAAGATLADRNQLPQRWEEVAALAHNPAERLKAMDADGVDAAVLYPGLAGLAGETFGRLTDPALELACVRAYNDWLIDEWADASPRFIPQCLVPLSPIEATVAEIERAVARGHRGVVYPAIPMHLRELPHINEAEYDPVWATCQELEVPICFHAGASPDIQFPPDPAFSPALSSAFQALSRPFSSATVLGNLLVSRILTRFPRLRVVFAESALGWGVFALEAADYHFEQFRLDLQGYELTPTELFKRQCYFTGWYDRHSLLHTHRFLGAQNILWTTNFPLATSTWPNSREFMARTFAPIPAHDRERMVWHNAAELYGVSGSTGEPEREGHG